MNDATYAVLELKSIGFQLQRWLQGCSNGPTTATLVIDPPKGVSGPAIKLTIPTEGNLVWDLGQNAECPPSTT